MNKPKNYYDPDDPRVLHYRIVSAERKLEELKIRKRMRTIDDQLHLLEQLRESTYSGIKPDACAVVAQPHNEGE